MPGTRRLSAHERRQSILAVATAEFARAGYDRARVADIATRLDLSEPVIFQRFGTKADLFAAVVAHASEALASQLEAAFELDGNAGAMLAGLLSSSHLTDLHEHGQLGLLLAEASRPSAPGPARLAADEGLTRIAQALAGILRRGQFDDSIRRDVEAIDLAWVVLSFIQAWAFRGSQGHGRVSLLEDEIHACAAGLLRPAVS